MQVLNPLRKFKLNQRIIEDTASHLPFEQAFKLFQRQNPLARGTTVFEEDGVLQADGSLLFELYIPSKTNG
ncbi:hypothetical protein ACP3V3_01695 [Vibrio sp. PNB22_3_1]